MSEDRMYLCRFLKYKSDYENSTFVVMADNLDQATRKAFINVAQNPSFWDGRHLGIPDSLVPEVQKLIPKAHHIFGLTCIDCIRSEDMMDFLKNLREPQIEELIVNFYDVYPGHFSVERVDVLA